MKIVAAAVRYTPRKSDQDCPDFGPVTISVPPPGRHGDILTPLSQMHETAAFECEQGFLGDNGQFYGRISAKQIVRDYQQPTIRDCHRTELFSEDLW